jgi:hypothetical protein
MPDLPVKRMVLYKHGVGFFERYGQVGNAVQVELVFKKEEMNDVLKSLAVFPQGEGQVLNISYETPEDKRSALEKAPILLNENAALLGLLRSLRGRQVCLHLMEANITVEEGQVVESTIGEGFEINGTLLGIDAEAGLDKARVSILTAGNNPGEHPVLRTYRLPQLQGLDVLDPQSGDDLRYVLELNRASGDKRSVTILLNQSNQELLVSYIAPTPTWRVSYRLVYTADQPTEGTTEAPETGKLLLQGWGIVDNQLDEDLEEVELTLIAGQPISFVYDLYTPRLIQRPQVTDEERTVTGPVMFEEALTYAAPAYEPEEAMYDVMLAAAPAPAGMAQRRMQAAKRDMAAATKVQATGIARGELFQYDVSNPVSIKRGQSAMVQILGATLDGRKEHIYNSEKVSANPVVTVTITNTTGLTLERGPVTVLDRDNYVGEAVIAFTPVEGELFVPYAVDLGVRITPTTNSRTELAAIRFGKDDYLLRDEYDIQQTEYQIENRNPEPLNLVIEQRIRGNYELFSTPAPFAQTAEFYRWRITVLARFRMQFLAQERRLISRYEAIRDLSYRTLSDYLRNKLIDQAFFNQLNAILDLYQQVNQNRTEINKRSQQREHLATELESAAEKLQPLGRDGSEGELRKRYVAKMQQMEDESDLLAQEIARLETTHTQLQQEIQTQLQTLG